MKAVVLVPTRELCDQTRDYIAHLCAYCKYITTVALSADDKPQELKYAFTMLTRILVVTTIIKTIFLI